MFRFCSWNRSASTVYSSIISLFDVELSKLLSNNTGSPSGELTKTTPQRSFFIEHRQDNHHYYAMYIDKSARSGEDGKVNNKTVASFDAAINVFDCPLTKKLLRSQVSMPIYLEASQKSSPPTEEDLCILFLRYPKRYSRSLRDIKKPTQSAVHNIPSQNSAIVLDTLPNHNEQEQHRLAFLYRAYILAMRIVFPDAYQSLIESNVQLAQEEDMSEPLIQALNMLSENSSLKRDSGMGYFFVVYSLVNLFQNKIKEEIRKIHTYTDFEQHSRGLEESSDNFTLIPTVFSTKEIDWGKSNLPLYASSIRWTAENEETSAIMVLTPCPFLSWYGLYLECIKAIDVGMYHTYTDFIAQEKSLKLSPALNALGVITLCLKRFYGRKIIAVTKGEHGQLACDLIYLVERDVKSQISKLGKLEDKGTAMTFFSYSTTTKKEAIKQCSLLALVTFFPQFFEEVKKLDWYDKSTPIVAGGSSASCPMHSIATEVHHSSPNNTLGSTEYTEISSHRMVQKLNEVFDKEPTTLPTYLKGAKITACAQKMKVNLSNYTVVRLLAEQPQNKMITQEENAEVEQMGLSLEALPTDEHLEDATHDDLSKAKPVLLAQVFSKSKSSAMLHACCMVAQSYFPDHLEEFARYVMINQEKFLLEEDSLRKSRDRKGDTENGNDGPRDVLKSRIEDKEPFIQQTLDLIRENIKDRSALDNAIHNLFLVNHKRPKHLRPQASHPDRIDISSNLSVFRTCAQKAARLNLKPLAEKVSIIPMQPHQEGQQKCVSHKTYKVSLQTIGEKTVIQSTTSLHPLKAMLSLYKYLVSESDFCLKHMSLEQIRLFLKGRPFANHAMVRHSMGYNLIGLAGLENLLRSMTTSQYGYELKISLDEKGSSFGGSQWEATCLLSNTPSFIENGTENITEEHSPSYITKTGIHGVLDFSMQKSSGDDSFALVASACSIESKRHCLWRLYSATMLQLFPELYTELILKNESEGLIAAADIIEDMRNDRDARLPAVSECTKALPISAPFSCHLTNLRVSFALTANFLPVEEVTQIEKGYKASLWKESGSTRILIVEAESTSQLYAIFKAYENLAAWLGHEHILHLKNKAQNEAVTVEGPLLHAGDDAPKIKPMIELYHRMNEPLKYNPMSRVNAESLLEYGLKLQYGLELMIGTQKGDNCWTTMLYGVVTFQPKTNSRRVLESNASLWEKEWDVSSPSATNAVKRIFLAGCTCHTKANSLKMACIHVMQSALPAFYAVCPTLSSWKTPTDFIELIETDEEST